MAQADPPAVAAELSAARADVEDFTRQHSGIERDLHDIEVELAVIGTEGRSGRLDAARCVTSTRSPNMTACDVGPTPPGRCAR